MNNASNFTILQLVALDETGDSYHRIRWPGEWLAKQAPDWRVINLDAADRRRHEWARAADLLVTYQSNDQDLLQIIDERKKNGLHTLVEYNDNFYTPAISSPAAGVWNNPLVWNTYEKFIKKSDGLIVTGPGLHHLFKDLSDKPIHILENHLPEEPLPFDELFPDSTHEVRIGWAGSLGHMPDLLSITPLLADFVSQKDNTTVSIMGNRAIPSEIHLPEEKFFFTHWGTMREYIGFWRNMHIGIAPLLDTPYNHCRSDIKAVEMSSAGVLPILTRTTPYLKFINETGAPSFSSTDELRKLLQFYTQNIGEAKSVAEKCHNYVANNRIGIKRTERHEIYRSLLPEKASTYDWKLPLGYHEEIGEKDENSRVQGIIQQAQRLLQSRQQKEALAFIQEARESNPDSVDLEFVEAKLRTHTDQVKDGLTEPFPDDLRIPLSEISRLTNPEAKAKSWETLFDEMESRASQYRTTFTSEVTTLFTKDYDTFQAVRPLILKAYKLYPTVAAIVYRAGKYLESLNDYERALLCFRWLSKQRENFEINQKFLETFDKSYLNTWLEALKARISGKFATEKISL